VSAAARVRNVAGAGPVASGCGGGTAATGRLDGGTFRRVLGHFPTGVALVTAMTPSGPTGIAVNSFTSVSLDPPLVLFCVANSSSTWPALRQAGVFSVNVLGEDDADICRRFAQRGIDRFAGMPYHLGATGAPVLNGVAAHLDCWRYAVHDGGDHAIVLGRVAHLDADEAVRPLVFHGGHYCALQPATLSRSEQE